MQKKTQIICVRYIKTSQKIYVQNCKSYLISFHISYLFYNHYYVPNNSIIHACLIVYHVPWFHHQSSPIYFC